MSKRSESLKRYWRSKRAAKRRVKTTWKKRHPERTKELKRLSYAKQKERIRAQARERRRTDPEYRESANQRAREYYRRQRIHIRARENKKRAANREFHRERARRWRAAHRAACLLADIKKRCKQKGLECGLNESWIQQRLDSGRCELSGIPFEMEAKHFGPNGRHSPSIDRKDPNGPYTMENCRMVIWSLNRALCNYGLDYMVGVFRAVIGRLGDT